MVSPVSGGPGDVILVVFHFRENLTLMVGGHVTRGFSLTGLYGDPPGQNVWTAGNKNTLGIGRAWMDLHNEKTNHVRF
jgi:hypothetical protein